MTKNGDQDQALTNFIAEFIYDVAPNHEMEALKEQNQDDDIARWKLFVDESSNQYGCGALVLQTLSSEQMEYAIHIEFKVTNNKAKCGALLAGLRIATELGVKSLDAFSDSQLLIN